MFVLLVGVLSGKEELKSELMMFGVGLVASGVTIICKLFVSSLDTLQL